MFNYFPPNYHRWTRGKSDPAERFCFSIKESLLEKEIHLNTCAHLAFYLKNDQTFHLTRLDHHPVPHQVCPTHFTEICKLFIRDTHLIMVLMWTSYGLHLNIFTI